MFQYFTTNTVTALKTVQTYTNTLLKLSIITGSGLSEGEWSLKQPMGFTDGSDVVPQRREKARSALRCIVTTKSIADQNDCVALNADPHTAVAVFKKYQGTTATEYYKHFS